MAVPKFLQASVFLGHLSFRSLLFSGFLLLSSLCLLPSASQAKPPQGPLKSSYGDEDVKIDKAIPLQEAVKKISNWAGSNITVSGTVTKSCKSSGCWVSLQSGDINVRTIFKDHGFAVPEEIVGRRIAAYGVLEQKEISAARARHFAKDDGASKKELAAIQGPQKVYEFTATKIKIL